jgi:UDP-N-acetylmuramate dehydrogenase
MAVLAEFADICQAQQPLAPYTSLRLGGPAQVLARPRSVEELARLVRRCHEEQLPVHVLGGGSNVLVRDEGVRGVVIRLVEPAFTGVTVSGHRLRAGGGAPLSALISEAARRGLAGLETLIGVPGTVAGAVRTNAGGRGGSVTQALRQVEALDRTGEIQAGDADDWRDGPADGRVLLAAEFELEPDNPDAILKRMRKAWIHRKAHQPLTFQAAGRLFKDPRGVSAEQLIEQAGIQHSKVGGVELSERHANYVIAHEGATARDVLRLIDLVRSQVAERLGQMLEVALVVW